MRNNPARTRTPPAVAVAIVFSLVCRPLPADDRVGLLATPPGEVKTFRVFELAMGARAPGKNPYIDGPSVKAVFTGTTDAARGRVISASGFWDGGNVWRIRFAATAAGEWAYETVSTDPGLGGIRGRVVAVAATAAERDANPLLRGFLERDGYAWRLSDGTPFLPIGDTAWSFAEEIRMDEWQRWMRARQAQGFNTFLGCIWLGIYRREGLIPAFRDGDPATDALQPEYFRRLDEMVRFANDHGILMGLTIGGFPDNSKWFQRFATLARNERWFRYCVARYAAYNVRWCLYGEVNEKDPPKGWGGGITTWQQQVAHDARLVRNEDPYDHPIGSHHTAVDTSSAADPNIDYIEVQIDPPGKRTETQYRKMISYRRYGKPIWSEEYWYEPASYDNDVALGIRNTHRNFIAAMAFPTMGSLMRAHHPEFDIDTVETDPGALRMSYFAAFYRDLDFRRFAPASDRIEGAGIARQCGRFGDDYVIFVQGGGRVTLDLTGDAGMYAVTRLDINTGHVARLADVAGGGRRVIDSEANADVAIRVSKLHATSQPTADAVKGAAR